jgi:hypothetical protein
MIEIFTESFAAGETKTFMVQGEYIEILEAPYPVNVYMMDRSGAQLSTMRNAEASFFSRPGKYEVVQVQSNLAQTVRIFIGSGDAGTRRTSGVVQVVDGGKARSLAGVAFGGLCFLAGVGAQFTLCQLWNPPGSGKNLICESLFMFSTVAGAGNFVSQSAALATLYQLGQSKKLGGAASIGELRTATTAAPALGPTSLLGYGLAAGINTAVTPKEPYVIPPGKGLTAYSSTLSADLGVTFDYFEETV